MPRIILKPNSPEYADSQKRNQKRCCEMPGCPNSSGHKAPKHRGLNDYYHFCFEHIKEYNKAWDFFSGMSEREVQDHMSKSRYGDRPTWRFDKDMSTEEQLHKAARKTYFFSEEDNSSSSHQRHSNNGTFASDTSAPEHEALALMGLSPPVTLKDIKTEYKKLAKKHHPDLNRNNKKSEELLKKINMAYTILQLAFKDYSKLKERNS